MEGSVGTGKGTSGVLGKNKGKKMGMQWRLANDGKDGGDGRMDGCSIALVVVVGQDWNK